MSICNECWGKGWIEKQGVQFDCRKCKGTGVIENEPKTNEEWFCGLSTDEKAEKLTDFSFWLVPNYTTEDKREQIRKRIVEWLKQPHREE